MTAGYPHPPGRYRSRIDDRTGSAHTLAALQPGDADVGEPAPDRDDPDPDDGPDVLV